MVIIALDAMVRISDDRWGQTAVGLEILRQWDERERDAGR